jgi:hypothetical protein
MVCSKVVTTSSWTEKVQLQWRVLVKERGGDGISSDSIYWSTPARRRSSQLQEPDIRGKSVKALFVMDSTTKLCNETEYSKCLVDSFYKTKGSISIG